MEDFKTFDSFVNENVNASTKITDYAWDQLYSYTFTVYPHDITIITSADTNKILPLWREFVAMTNPKTNFDGFLCEKGYAAISANNPKMRPLDGLI